MVRISEEDKDTSLETGPRPHTRGDTGGEDAHSEGVDGRGGSSRHSSIDVADVDARVQLEVEADNEDDVSEEEALGEMLEVNRRPDGGAVGSNDCKVLLHSMTFGCATTYIE